MLLIGQRLVVTLATNWTAPQATFATASVTSALQPLRTDSSAGFPARVIAASTFTAIRVGEAAVMAHTDYACLHVSPRCAVAQEMFTVTIRVLPGPGHGAGPLPRSPHS